MHPDAGAVGCLPVPPGATSEQVALGKKIFHGEVAGATCAGCHGADGIGTPVGADLASGTWLWGDGSLQSITDTIKSGVPKPKQHPGAMPPFGGVQLSESDSPLWRPMSGRSAIRRRDRYWVARGQLVALSRRGRRGR